MLQSDSTYQQCLDEITADIGDSCSDFEIFSRAAKYYFKTAKIHFIMEIDLCGDIPKAHTPDITMTTNPEKSSLSISLDELLDF